MGTRIRLGTLRSLRRLVILASAMVTLLTTRATQARSAGIDSTQFSNANIGCLNCHGGGVAPMVNLSASATALAPGQQITLTFMVTTPNNDATNATHPNGAAGFNMRTDTGHPGTFALAPNTVGIRTTVGLGSQSEATHSTPKVGEPAVFAVLWSPNAGVTGTVTFTAWGNAVNFNGDTSGDLAAMTTLNVTICTPTTWYRDLDGDGFGNPNASTSSCTQPAGYVADHTDCNDGSAAVHPGATEVCNGIDDNCAGGIDEGLPTSTFYRDADGDGYGNPSLTKIACSLAQAGAGHVSNDGDCNDASVAIHPGATEVCNGVDDNCAGGIDEGLPTSTFYRDADGDGYGNPAMTKVACSLAVAGAGYVTNNTDCDDTNANIFPGAPEICGNQKDDNCNGIIDTDAPANSTFYRDMDSDGFGATTNGTATGCAPLAGYVSNATDCNDNNADIHPGATEVCNGKDDNCAAGIDDGLPTSTFYFDGDGDGYGNPSMSKIACSLAQAGAGYVTNNDDCNDASVAIHPGATEVCNGKDDNCAAGTDEGLGSISCGDGECSHTVAACVDGVPQTCMPACPDAGADASNDGDVTVSIDAGSAADGMSPPNRGTESDGGSPSDSGTDAGSVRPDLNRVKDPIPSDLVGSCTCRIGASGDRMAGPGFARIGVALGLLAIALRRRKRA